MPPCGGECFNRFLGYARNDKFGFVKVPKGKGRLLSKPAFINPGDDLLSPVRTTIGLKSLASEFGMGSGVSSSV